ncbi:MAG TPA: hypothetical protein VML50_12525 [Anaeromyxobacter sp.]|nr:hypothetical protein [Anaeromyxobacter sp.]
MTLEELRHVAISVQSIPAEPGDASATEFNADVFAFRELVAHARATLRLGGEVEPSLAARILGTAASLIARRARTPGGVPGR